MRLHKVQDSWGLSLRRLELDLDVEVCCDSGELTVVDGDNRSDMMSLKSQGLKQNWIDIDLVVRQAINQVSNSMSQAILRSNRDMDIIARVLAFTLRSIAV
ncbi:hypothetical protein ABVK25_004202 [Lepraria finkii]|uniref:Uncharacterized protein n=1 Tax=Lepraria finkii TaxID=1340010 RepID=A0ABR4BC26_9LECA